MIGRGSPLSVVKEIENVTIFKLTHVETGEIIRGTAPEIAIRFGIVRSLVYMYPKKGWKLQKVWVVEVEDAEQINNTIPISRLEEWDRVTQGLHEKIENNQRVKKKQKRKKRK